MSIPKELAGYVGCILIALTGVGLVVALLSSMPVSKNYVEFAGQAVLIGLLGPAIIFGTVGALIALAMWMATEEKP